MTADPRVFRILEDMADSGQSAEEACSDVPELLSQVKEQLVSCRRIDAQMDALFGRSGNDDEPANDPGNEQYPRIPGYHIISILGRGGMGVVYRARHLELNRIVALKMMLSGAYASGVQRSRFVREARAVASLRHFNIVQLYDVGEFEGCPFFTMEFVAGRTLADFLGGNPQSAQSAASMMLTLADAIDSAHRAGIIHRDLKPTNVLLTADGTLKISDFGLARRMEDQAAITISGVRVGTPSYMAPEQALGKETIEPAADLYSLGAILYEMLTGRPPFRGESSADTERQLLTQEPVQPSKLNARVPRDLETICLMCLRKDPRRRYPTAAAFAEDIRRFQQNQPISARRTGMLERIGKWARRHPSVATALGAGSLISVALIVIIFRLSFERAASNRLVEEELREAISFQTRSSWKEATASIEKAAALLGDHGPAGLQAKLAQARRDSALAERLDAICLEQAGSVDGVMQFQQTGQKYATAFNSAALGEGTDDPDQVASRIRNSNIRNSLVSAIYDWMLCADTKTRIWLWEIVRRVDHDPTGWRDRVCESAIWNHGQALSTMVDGVIVSDHSAPFLMAVGRQLKALNQETIPFLKKVQDAYPQDFWVSLTLADALRENGEMVESLRFYQAAIALRPNAAVSYNNMGMALDHLQRYEEAVTAVRHAIHVDPQAQMFRNSLAGELFLAGHFAEAIPVIQQCLGKNNQESVYRDILAQSLEHLGREDEAIEVYRDCIALYPKDSLAQKSLRTALIQLGHNDEAVTVWQNAIAANRQEHPTWDGLAEFYLYLGRTADYQNTRAQLLQRFGGSKDPGICERIAKTCLLQPATPDQTRTAMTLIDYAVAQDRLKPSWVGPYFQFTKGLAEYRSGQFASAMSILSGQAAGVFGPAPKLLSAMCQWRLGQTSQARESLARGVASYSWDPPLCTQEFWMYQAFRQEAQAMIEPARPDASNNERGTSKP